MSFFAIVLASAALGCEIDGHMSTEKVAIEIQNAIAALSAERDELAAKIDVLKDTLAKLGGGRRKPGRPKGSGTKKKAAPAVKAAPAAPAAKAPAAKKAPAPKKAAAKKAPAAKKKGGRKKPNWSPEAKKAAAERMRKYWSDRKKKEGRK